MNQRQNTNIGRTSRGERNNKRDQENIVREAGREPGQRNVDQWDMYWVGQKVFLGFSIIAYRKTQMEYLGQSNKIKKRPRLP